MAADRSPTPQGTEVVDVAAPTPDATLPAEARRRAAALPAEARRRAIVRATVPLLLAHGPAVTTRQIAEAAGVAEGTIFRVFPDKDAVIDAAIGAAFDPQPTYEAVRAIPADLPLEERLVAAVELLQRRMGEIWRLMAAVGYDRLPDGARPGPPRPGPPHPGARHFGDHDNRVLAEVFGADVDRLRCPLPVVASALRGLVFGGTHPAFVPDGQVQTPTAIVELLLHGVLDAPPPCSGPADRPPPSRPTD